MKTFKHVLNLSFAAVLLSLTSCVSDDFLAVTEPEIQNEGNPLTLTVTQGNPSDTRLALGQDGLSTEWEPGDTLVLVDKARKRAPIYLICTLTANANQATFLSEGGVPEDEYWVIYNYNEHLVYTHQSLSSIEEINEKDKLVLYGEVSVMPNTSSAAVSLQHLYAKMSVRLENLPGYDEMGNSYTIGMYSSKKGFPLYRMIKPNGFVDAEYGQDPNNQNRGYTYFQSDRKEHNIRFGGYNVEYSETYDPQTGSYTYNPTNLAQLETYSALVLPGELSGEDVFFYVLHGGEGAGSAICYEIKKENVKLVAGKSYTVVLDLNSATKTELTGFWDGNSAEYAYDGISSPAEWRHLVYRNYVYACKLTSDIDFSNEYFFPLPASKIYGNGKTMKNIHLDWEEDNVGLTKSSFVNISNLALENVTFKGRNNVGAFGGRNVSADNCKIIGQSVISGTGDYVGGIVGWNKMEVDNGGNKCILSNVSISQECSVSGVSYVGGIVGAVEQRNNYTYTFNSSQKPLDNCISSATVTATGDYVGGIFGKIGGNRGNSFSGLEFSMEDYTYTLLKCQNSGSVTGRNYVGGIGGEFACSASSGSVQDRVVLSQSFSDGTVSGENNVGGILGSSTCASVNTCYSINSITGTDNVGGVIGAATPYLSESRIANCYSISDLVVGSDKKAGGIVGNGRNGGPVGISVINSYFAGTNPQGSGIIGYSGACGVENCLTTLASLGTNLGTNVDFPDVITNSQTGVTSILQNISVINGNNAYSTTTWPSSQFGFECVKFASFLVGGLDSPDFGDGGEI